MPEIPVRTGATPARDRRDLRALALVAGGLAVAVGAFVAGRASVTEPPDASCIGIRNTHASTLAAGTTKGPASWAEAHTDPDTIRRAAYLVVQNEGCFTAGVRADAQAALDRLNARR